MSHAKAIQPERSVLNITHTAYHQRTTAGKRGLHTIYFPASNLLRAFPFLPEVSFSEFFRPKVKFLWAHRGNTWPGLIVGRAHGGFYRSIEIGYASWGSHDYKSLRQPGPTLSTKSTSLLPQPALPPLPAKLARNFSSLNESREGAVELLSALCQFKFFMYGAKGSPCHMRGT